MGSKKEFNWVLKSPIYLENLVVGQTGSFEKEEERIYPINIPIFLANPDWTILAGIKILEYSASEDKTTAKYEIIKIFKDEQRDMLTKIHREFYSKHGVIDL